MAHDPGQCNPDRSLEVDGISRRRASGIVRSVKGHFSEQESGESRSRASDGHASPIDRMANRRSGSDANPQSVKAPAHIQTPADATHHKQKEPLKAQ